LRGTKLIGAVRLAGKTTQMIKNIFQEKLERGRDFHENLSLATNDWSRAKTCYCISYRRQPRTSLIITRILQI